MGFDLSAIQSCLLIFQYRSKNDKKIVRANVPRNHEEKKTATTTANKSMGFDLSAIQSCLSCY